MELRNGKLGAASSNAIFRLKGTLEGALARLIATEGLMNFEAGINGLAVAFFSGE